MKKLLAVLFLFCLAACSPNLITGNNPATLRDTIFSEEPRENGTVSYWMTHDDLGTYCTQDATVEKKMHDSLFGEHGEILLSYRTYQLSDPACGQERGDGAKTYLILGVTVVGQ